MEVSYIIKWQVFCFKLPHVLFNSVGDPRNAHDACRFMIKVEIRIWIVFLAYWKWDNTLVLAAVQSPFEHLAK